MLKENYALSDSENRISFFLKKMCVFEIAAENPDRFLDNQFPDGQKLSHPEHHFRCSGMFATANALYIFIWIIVCVFDLTFSFQLQYM